MLLAPLLALTLSAAPAPRAWQHAETVLHVPSITAAGPVASWLSQAGQRAALLRVSSWRDAFHPLFLVDPTSADSLVEVGLSATGGFTVSQDPRTHVTCASLADPEKFRKAAEARLSAEGQIEVIKKKDSERALVLREGKAVAGYAIAKDQVCAFSAPAGSQSLPDAIVTLATRAPKPDARFSGLSGSVFTLSRQGLIALDAQGSTLIVSAKTRELPAPALLPGGATPYSQPSGDALLSLRTRLPTSSAGVVVRTLEHTLKNVCTNCETSTLSRVASALAPMLTGHALAHVTRVQVKDSLRTPVGRFNATKHALLAETSQPQKAAAAIASLASLKGAGKTEDGITLAVRGGELRIGVRNNQVYFTNDADALTAALSAVKPDTMKHGAMFRVDPKALARGLNQVSLLDAMGGGKDAKLLTGLLAFSTEAGPLLAISESIDGWADPQPGGGHRFELRWKLPEPTR